MKSLLALVILLVPIISYSQDVLYNNDNIIIIKERDRLFFETKTLFGIPAMEGDAQRLSYLIKGILPLDLKSYNVTGHGYSFQYPMRNEVIVEPIVFPIAECQSDAKEITLNELAIQKFFNDSSPHHSLWDMLIDSFHLWTDTYWNQSEYVLIGDIAIIYIRTSKNRALEYIRIIKSGCKTTEQFDSQYRLLERELGKDCQDSTEYLP